MDTLIFIGLDYFYYLFEIMLDKIEFNLVLSFLIYTV